jgi:maltooligosyltrehalose trehalohydrolase
LDVLDRSLVVDPRFSRSDNDWKRPPFRDLVIYELYIGTFTADGTFLSARDRLQDLRDLGKSAIEIMPPADFSGERGWGYDGVLIFAPARTYGSPADLRSLVDHAHSLGIVVILNVVYNHFGLRGTISSGSAKAILQSVITNLGGVLLISIQSDASRCVSSS